MENCNGKLHFKYKSPENITLLLLNILYERRETINFEDKLNFLVWKNRFQQDDAEEVMLKIMESTFPDGVNIGEKELETLLESTIKFIEHDDTAIRIAVGTKRSIIPSYAYSKYDNKVTPCDFGYHTETIMKLCHDFFGRELYDYPKPTIEKFILENFQLKGNQLSIEAIAADISKNL